MLRALTTSILATVWLLASAASAQTAGSAATPAEKPEQPSLPATTTPAAEVEAESAPQEDPTAPAEVAADPAPVEVEARPDSGVETEQQLAPTAPGYAVVLSARPAAMVSIEDGAMGARTPASLELGLGSHRVTFEADGHPPLVVYVTVLGPSPENRVIVDVAEGRVVAAEGEVTADVDVVGPPDPAPTPTAEPVLIGETVPEVDCGNPLCVRAGPLAIWPTLRLRAGIEIQQPDNQALFIGNNDGFRLYNARLGFEGAYKDLATFRLVLEGAGLFPHIGSNQPVQPAMANLVDAIVHVRATRFFQVWVGQGFVPADYEGQLSRNAQVFTERSVAIAGVAPGRGYEMVGLSPGRQLGVTVGSEDASVGPVFLEYRASIANGNGPRVIGNDNKLPAGYLRLGAGYERWVRLGFGGSLNPRTNGALPTLYNETDLTGFADVHVDAFGFDLLAQGVVRQTTFDSVYPDITAPERAAYGWGVTGWLFVDEPFGLPMLGLKPGVRVSAYDPTSSYTDDQLLEATVGLRYDPVGYDLPIAVLVDATALLELDETGLRPLDNNRVVALLHLEI